MRFIMLCIALFMLISGLGILGEYGPNFIGLCIFSAGLFGVIATVFYDEEEWLA